MKELTNTMLKHLTNPHADSTTITTHQITTHQVATQQGKAHNMLIHEVILDTPSTTLEDVPAAAVQNAPANQPLRAQHQFIPGPNGLVYSGIVWIAHPTSAPTPTNLHAKAA